MPTQSDLLGLLAVLSAVAITGLIWAEWRSMRRWTAQRRRDARRPATRILLGTLDMED